MLSQLLVAFTIEFDNEFEHRTPHRTTDFSPPPVSSSRSSGVPWLVSMPMWSLVLQFVPLEGIPVRELLPRVSLPKKLTQNLLVRLSKWWGYLTIEGGIVRPSSGGRKALEVWQPLTGGIEQRWRERFKETRIDRLRESLWAVVSQFDADLPDHMTLVEYGLKSQSPDSARSGPRDQRTFAATPLPALLSKVLLTFTLDFERVSKLSLPICANILRPLRGNDASEGVAARDVSALAGIAKDSVANSLKFLAKLGCVKLSTVARAKVVLLTPKGELAREAHMQLVHAIEEQWRARFGADKLAALRQSLEEFVPEPATPGSRIFEGLKPYADCWRAMAPPLEALPHQALITHRGGFPDGS